jgi:hypothetical protein
LISCRERLTALISRGEHVTALSSRGEHGRSWPLSDPSPPPRAILVVWSFPGVGTATRTSWTAEVFDMRGARRGDGGLGPAGRSQPL